MSQFTITGFDACAHMSEETVGADKSAPIAIVMAIGVSAVAGFAYILAITFSIQVSKVDFAHVICGAQHMHGTPCSPRDLMLQGQAAALAGTSPQWYLT